MSLINKIIIRVLNFLKKIKLGCHSEISRSSAFDIILLLTVMMFIKLMLSGSYPVEPYFYLMLGLGIGAIRRAKAESNMPELER